MGSNAEEKAALAVGVTAMLNGAAVNGGVRGLFYRATLTASNVALELPKLTGSELRPMRSRWFAIYSASSPVQYAFSNGVAAATLVYDQDVTAGTGSVAAGATVPAGVVWERMVPPDANFISIIGPATASGKVEIYISEGPG